MNKIQTIGSIAAMIFTAGSMVTMWTFAALSLANNKSEESLHRVKLWVLNFSLLCLVGIGIGIWLLVQKRYALSTGVSLLPAAVMFIALVWQIIRPS
jgi:hypothetical protein